jgi:tetratricopeptide (TPR) repeat protein
VNARIPSLVLLFLTCASPLCAQDSPGTNAMTNPVPLVTLDFTGQVNQATSIPVLAAEVPSNPKPVADSPGQTTKVPVAVMSEPEKSSPAADLNAVDAGVENARVTIRPGENLMWLALIVATVVSLAAIVLTWRTARQNPATAPAPARMDTPAALAPNLLPVISQAIKEALMQELATQRRELLSAQQTAAAELASLARRLEAVQTPLLERLGGLRPSALPAAQFHREIPVKIYCGCGQKYSFEVQPVAGRVPFPIACPACGQDGTHQANQVIARILNGITQSLPSPGRPALVNATPSGLTPQLVDAVKQAVIKELSASRAEAPNTVPMADIQKSQNSPAPLAHYAGSFVTNLLVEGQSLADAGELEKAAKCFEAALMLQPDRAEALVKMGGVLDKQDRAEEALQYYDRAIALDESLTIAYLNKGGLFNRLARYDEAQRCYEQALHKQKKSAA